MPGSLSGAQVELEQRERVDRHESGVGEDLGDAREHGAGAHRSQSARGRLFDPLIDVERRRNGAVVDEHQMADRLVARPAPHLAIGAAVDRRADDQVLRRDGRNSPLLTVAAPSGERTSNVELLPIGITRQVPRQDRARATMIALPIEP